MEEENDEYDYMEDNFKGCTGCLLEIILGLAILISSIALFLKRMQFI